MLVLTRRVDESIVIRDDIVVTVLSVEGDRVKLGVQAPREVLVLRQELLQAVEAQNRAAARQALQATPETLARLKDLLGKAR